MAKYYSSEEERDAYREGRKDADYGRTNYEYNRYESPGTPDRAYFDGRRDRLYEKEQERQEQEFYDNEFWSMRGE